MDQLDWRNIKLVVFDVDGTMYNQKRLRQKMFFSLISYYLPRPLRWSELRILKTFREERENHKSRPTADLQHDQYVWCQTKTGKDIERIKKVVKHWILEYPLRLLHKLVYPGLHELFAVLNKAGIPVAVLSDYPAEEKMRAMDLQADLVIDAADKRVNALKPDPAGLKFIAEYFKTDTRNIVFIGDREDTDGEAARRIKMQCIVIDKKKIYNKNYFRNLAEQIATR
ncbi:MAG: HAD family hydrolase [Bacteroidales bacterium]|nr:HAD family hydrolase [Bacteroidales bacterium]